MSEKPERRALEMLEDFSRKLFKYSRWQIWHEDLEPIIAKLRVEQAARESGGSK